MTPSHHPEMGILVVDGQSTQGHGRGDQATHSILGTCDSLLRKGSRSPPGGVKN